MMYLLPNTVPSVYHPAMQHILTIAMIEVKRESTQEISFFWKPQSNTGGGEWCYYANQEAFDVDFMTSKVVSCQMHYKNDINKPLL